MSKLRGCFDLPDSAMYNGGIAVCQYLNPDGSMDFGYNHDIENLPLANAIGLLELAKRSLIERAFE